ncbi:MAG: hypothetical protein NUW23_12310 [Firmicutes bacterium]|nr:hypothetical protein [Bacillota bacterium]
MSRDWLGGLIEGAQKTGQIRRDLRFDLIVFYVNALSTEFGKLLADRIGVEFTELFLPENLSRVKDLDLPGAVEDLVRLMKTGLQPQG